MPKGPNSTPGIFAAGAIGGVALDILSLYFAGFPEGHTASWYLGRLIIILLFMAMTGFLAYVYSNGQVRTAFVIGVAAPSILLNIAASVQRPKEVVPTLQSIPAPGATPGASLGTLWRAGLFAVSIAEAQPPSATASVGQLRVSIREAPAGVDPLKYGELLVFDSAGRLIAKTVPPSQTFVFALPRGKYSLQYKTPQLRSHRIAVTVDEHHVNEVMLPVAPISPAASSEGWNDFINGIGSQLNKVKERRQ